VLPPNDREFTDSSRPALRPRAAPSDSRSDPIPHNRIARRGAEARFAVAELAEARALIAKKFSSPPSNESDRARAARFLMSRGYGASVVAKALRGIGQESKDLD